MEFRINLYNTKKTDISNELSEILYFYFKKHKFEMENSFGFSLMKDDTIKIEVD